MWWGIGVTFGWVLVSWRQYSVPYTRVTFEIATTTQWVNAMAGV